jgi:hypothetical protein
VRKIVVIMVLGIMVLCITAGTVYAYLIDTGQGATVGIGYNISSNQYLAAEFYLDQPSIITGIEGWINCSTSGNLIVAIYTDGGEVPGTKLHSAEFFAISQSASNWKGPTALNWNLESGTYWVAFETPTSEAAYAGMPSPPRHNLWKMRPVRFQEFGLQMIL